MRTTVTIDDDIIAELMKSEKTKNPAEAIRSAVQQHVRARRPLPVDRYAYAASRWVRFAHVARRHLSGNHDLRVRVERSP